jgi:hypothetical protein
VRWLSKQQQAVKQQAAKHVVLYRVPTPIGMQLT